MRAQNFLLEPKAAPRVGAVERGAGEDDRTRRGRKLGKYEIRQKLGPRRHGRRVSGAGHASTARRVALKLIEHSPDADTRDAIEAERRGAELQAQLAAIDPRVVRVYDCGDVDGFFYVAMEYIDGQDLAELMRRGPLAPEFAADVAIARGADAGECAPLCSRDRRQGVSAASCTAISSRRTSASMRAAKCGCWISASPRRSRFRAG